MGSHSPWTLVASFTALRTSTRNLPPDVLCARSLSCQPQARRKLSGLWLWIAISTFIATVVRTVVVSCPKETTKAATLWMDTSSVRPATLPASGCSPPRPAPTSKYSRLLSCLVGGAEKKEAQDKDKKWENTGKAIKLWDGLCSSSNINLSLEAHR
ncbi:unnamed protein product [Gulo gulo]|uniref:Uncharacterized protein n=1 Tax=Gulo gulo TaxID=48420 RepID=A0A9X9LMA7_GULGU|nr:unnamed protein product [Gulo gulo]